MGRVAQVSLAAVGLLTPASPRACEWHTCHHRSSADPGPGRPTGLRAIHPRFGTAPDGHLRDKVAPISKAVLRTSLKAGCRSCSVRRNADRTPALRSIGGLRPIRARARSQRLLGRQLVPVTILLARMRPGVFAHAGHCPTWHPRSACVYGRLAAWLAGPWLKAGAHRFLRHSARPSMPSVDGLYNGAVTDLSVGQDVGA
jgi:hypothetical protein